MQRFWSALAVQLGKRAGLVSVVGLLITVVLGMGITQLEFATGQDSYLNTDEAVFKDSIAYQKLFGGQAMLTVVTMDPGHTIDEIYTQDGQAQLTRYHDNLMKTDRFTGVITPLTAAEFSDSLIQSPDGVLTNSVAGKALLAALAKEVPGSPEAAARQGDSVTTLTRVGAFTPEQRVLSNPEWVKFLLYNNPTADGETTQVRKALRSFIVDDRHAQVIVRVKGNESIAREGEASTLVQAEAAKLKFPNATVTTTGAPVLLKDINDYLKGGMLTLGGAAVGIMIIILLLLFDVRWRLLPLGVILVGCIWAFGLAGYLGIPLTIVTIAGLPVLLGVGIDYAIQMHARVEEEVILDHSEAPIQETARNLGPALLVVTFDAIFAFLALQFAKVPMIRYFGLLLAVGIAVICFCSIILPLAVLGIREFKSPTKGRDFREGFLGRFVVKLGSLPTAFAVPLAIASVVIFLGGAAVEGKLTLQTDPVEWVNPDSQSIKDFRTVERETGSSSELGVFVTADDVFTDEFTSYVHEFTRNQISGSDGTLLTGNSIETTVGDLLEVEGATPIAPRGEDVRAAYTLAPADVKASTVANDGAAFNIAFRAAPGSLTDRAVIIRGIRKDTSEPPGVRTTPSGLAVVGIGLLDNLEANRVLLTYLAILFVFLFLCFRLRSVIRSLLSLVPVLIATGMASLAAYQLDLVLSPMTAVGGPLVVATCTEFTSLILLRFVEERQRGLDPRRAMNVTASRTGRAFIVSGLTAISGVAVLSLSSLPLLRDFGRIVGMNITVALLSALIILPPMLVWADNDKRLWVSKGLVKSSDENIETPYQPDPTPAPAP